MLRAYKPTARSLVSDIEIAPVLVSIWKQLVSYTSPLRVTRVIAKSDGVPPIYVGPDILKFIEGPMSVTPA